MATATKTPTQIKEAASRKRSATRTKNLKEDYEKKIKALRAKKTAKKKGFLNDFMTPSEAKGGTDVLMSGAGAAFLINAADRLIGTAGIITEKRKPIAYIAGGFLVATMGGRPYMGAGMTAIGVDRLLQRLTTKPLADNGYLMDGHYVDNIEKLPPVLDAYGQPMDDNGGYLQDGGYGMPYLPSYTGGIN